MHRLAKTAVLAMATFVTRAGSSPELRRADEPPPPPSATEDEQPQHLHRSRSRTTSSTGSAGRTGTTPAACAIGWLSPAITDMPPGHRGDDHHPDLLRRARSRISVIRRIARVGRPEHLHAREHLHVRTRSTTTGPTPRGSMRASPCSTPTSGTIAKTGIDEPMRLDTLQLDLGVIGPAAGGEFVQNNFHKLIGVRPGQRLGQPAAQRADGRPHLRAALAHRPRRC